MSEHITHIAIADDVRRLALRMESLPAPLRDAWHAHADVARAGGITRQADKWSADVVAHVRDTPGDADGSRKLAFVLGALTHRAIDRQMKPVFAYFKQQVDARVDPATGAPINECTIYCDAHVLREVHAIDSLYDAVRLGDAALASRRSQVHELVRTTLQRVLIQMHTLKPDSSDVHAWMSRLFASMQDFDLRLSLYEEVLSAPDPAKHRRFVVETHFYDPSDPLIALARSAHRDGRDGGAAFDDRTVRDAAALTTERSSLYARAMRRAIEYVDAAADLFAGRASIDDVRRRLDIGTPELSLAYVPPRQRAAAP